MTNKEKYKQAFSVLHTSENFSPEVEIMAKLNKKNKIRGIIAACIGIFTIGGLSTTAYAANVGNIQRQIQLWVQGDQTTATLDIDETQGEYKISYTGTDGAPVEISGGGITIDINGNEKPVNEQEIMEHIMMPSVEYLDDGTIWVYYKDRQMEITDKFDEEGFCFTQIADGGMTYYMTIKKNGGYGIDTIKYPSKKGFNY
jgi:hypothetical protein